MKTAIIFADGIKQIMFTPENDSEKQALQLITPDDNIYLALKHGSFFGSGLTDMPFHAHIAKCQGEYLRAFTDEESIMLVFSPKSKESNEGYYVSVDRFKEIYEKAKANDSFESFYGSVMPLIKTI